ncbi:MAG: hypothetical protein ACKVOX_19000 [Rhizobacter sp.]
MVSMKSEEVSRTHRIVGSDDMLNIDAKAKNEWIEGGAGVNTNLKLIKAGSGDDQVYASTTQTLADAVAAQEGAVATGRSDLLLDCGFANDSVFGPHRAELFGDEKKNSIQLEIGARIHAANEQLAEAA